MDYWGGGGKGYVAPLSNYWGGGAGPPLPTPMKKKNISLISVSFYCCQTNVEMKIHINCTFPVNNQYVIWLPLFFSHIYMFAISIHISAASKLY